MMRRKASGTPIFFNRNKLLNNHGKDKTMTYNDEHYGNSKIAYDGELIDLQDASYRLKRDRARQHAYSRAEEMLDDQQLTWDEVNEMVEETESTESWLAKLI